MDLVFLGTLADANLKPSLIAECAERARKERGEEASLNGLSNINSDGARIESLSRIPWSSKRALLSHGHGHQEKTDSNVAFGVASMTLEIHQETAGGRKTENFENEQGGHLEDLEENDQFLRDRNGTANGRYREDGNAKDAAGSNSNVQRSHSGDRSSDSVAVCHIFFCVM